MTMKASKPPSEPEPAPAAPPTTIVVDPAAAREAEAAREREKGVPLLERYHNGDPAALAREAEVIALLRRYRPLPLVVNTETHLPPDQRETAWAYSLDRNGRITKRMIDLAARRDRMRPIEEEGDERRRLLASMSSETDPFVRRALLERLNVLEAQATAGLPPEPDAEEAPE